MPIKYFISKFCCKSDIAVVAFIACEVANKPSRRQTMDQTSWKRVKAEKGSTVINFGTGTNIV